MIASCIVTACIMECYFCPRSLEGRELGEGEKPATKATESSFWLILLSLTFVFREVVSLVSKVTPAMTGFAILVSIQVKPTLLWKAFEQLPLKVY